MRIDVIVIGGGFAGLSAATALAERGACVTVLEARPSLGGRAATFTDPSTGERVDNGQHVLLGGYHETFRFLRRIGMESRVHLQPNLSIGIVDRAGRASRFACPPIPAPLHLLGGLIRWRALDWRDRRSALRLARAVRSSRAPACDDCTVLTWLKSCGQTARLIELLWEPLAVAALNQPIDVAAATPFVTVLRRMFGVGRGDAALGLPMLPLEDLYAVPAHRFIEGHGGAVRVNAPARVRVDDGVRVFVRDEELSARAVICAAPWFALSEVFTGYPAALASTLDAADATAPSPIVTVNLWLDRPVAPGMFVGLPGRTMQWVFDKRTLFGESASHLSLVSSAAEELVTRSNQEITELAVQELVAALPAVHHAAVRRAVVVRERRATFSVAPGQPPRPAVRTAVPGLLLAGDWIDTGLPATIESAVISGHRAAVEAWAMLDTAST